MRRSLIHESRRGSFPTAGFYFQDFICQNISLLKLYIHALSDAMMPFPFRIIRHRTLRRFTPSAHPCLRANGSSRPSTVCFRAQDSGTTHRRARAPSRSVRRRWAARRSTGCRRWRMCRWRLPCRRADRTTMLSAVCRAAVRY